MKFGPVQVRDAVGAILAHATEAGECRFPKAHRLTADDVGQLTQAGVRDVVVAVLSPGDLDENAAAGKLVAGMRFAGVEAKPAATGRVNLHAASAGVFTVDKGLVDALNAIDPAMTLATLADMKHVDKGDMVATMKIIPFAVPGELVTRAVALLARAEIFTVHPYRAASVALVQTVLPGVKGSVLAKTARVIASRLARCGSGLSEELHIPHDATALSEALADLAARSDLVVVFGASALCDREDVIPAAIELAGGEVLRAGMPVDPGNLLVLGRLGRTPVVGAPGCARSPKENGFDWVLERLLAGVDVSSGDIASMGVGGLLMEIPTRPQPRDSRQRAGGERVEAVVLAAGRSTRMGGPNKLMAHFDGKPLIRQTVDHARASGARGVLVVTGHQPARIRAALDALDVRFVHNADFASGLASSLKAGIAAVGDDADGALILLGDMPAVSSQVMNRLLSAFREADGRAIVRATHDGRRGNPVLLPRALFGAVSQLHGDTGARHLVEAGMMPVVDIEVGEGAMIDVDTREALERAGGVIQD
ncbi:MAG: molybdopterin-binding/glycosyltransferase family 2 protein [Hyphomicrobiales bacterium]|nr:molybdopterin-binding/glycosyltransferase family 2 protein [Hyphomicrobiales bacterium]